MVAALAFIVMLLGLGIPVWWSTTTVKRASLPMEDLENLDYLSAKDQSYSFIYKSGRDTGEVSKQLDEFLSGSKEICE